jgi:hypothetical protein
VAKQNQNEEHFLVERHEEPKRNRTTKTNKAPSSTPTLLPTPSIPDSLPCLSTSSVLPIGGDHGQVRALPYPSFKRNFNLVLYFRTPPSNRALPPLSPLSGARISPPSSSLVTLLVPVHLSNPITLATLIMLLNALLTTRRVRTTATFLS